RHGRVPKGDQPATQGGGRALLQCPTLDRDAARRPLRSARGADTAGRRYTGFFPPHTRLSQGPADSLRWWGDHGGVLPRGGGAPGRVGVLQARLELGLWGQELVLGGLEGPQLILELRRLRQLRWREDIVDLLCQGEVLLLELVALTR